LYDFRPLETVAAAQLSSASSGGIDSITGTSVRAHSPSSRRTSRGAALAAMPLGEIGHRDVVRDHAERMIALPDRAVERRVAHADRYVAR